MIIDGTYIPDDMAKQIRTIFDNLRKKVVPKNMRNQVYDWFLDEDNTPLKEEGMSGLFGETFDYEKKPRQRSHEMYSEFARKNGLQEKQHAKVIKMPLRRNYLMKVAAVLIPAMVASVAVYVLVEKAADTVVPATVAVVQVSVPAGGETISDQAPQVDIILAENQTHTLPDASTVRLGKGSTISHSETFEGERRVELHGAARFNVQKRVGEEGIKEQFTVHTDHLDIRVLGTEFDVHSPAGESHSVIDLLHGGVEVLAGGKTYLMSPRDHLHYDHDTKSATISKIPHGELRYDQMPTLIFEETPITDIFSIVERDYGVSFTIEGEIPDSVTAISGDLTRITTLDELMGKLQKLSGRFDYRITDSEIRILIKPII